MQGNTANPSTAQAVMPSTKSDLTSATLAAISNSSALTSRMETRPGIRFAATELRLPNGSAGASAA